MASNVSLAFGMALGMFLAISISSFQLPSNEQLETASSIGEKRSGDSSHWCCKGNLTPKIVYTSRLEVQKTISHENYTYVLKYVPCDKYHVNISLTYCPVYKTEIVDVPRYTSVVVRLNHTETPVCREQDLVCCKGFESYQNNCYKPDQLATIKALGDLIG